VAGIPLGYLAVPWTGLVLLAGLAWLVTVRQARGMGTEPGTVGMSVPVFLFMWVAMMAAMMFPSVAPIAILWARSITMRSTGLTRFGRITSFVTGYLLAWAAYGMVAFVVLAGAGRLVDTAPEQAKWLGAAIFAVAGLYQLTPLKDICLSHCRSPIAQLLHYGNYSGRLRDLRVGIHHGAFCVGCCWALMLILVATGVMNIAVMALIAAIIFLEKLWQHGNLLRRTLGAAFLVAAVLAPFNPWLLPALHHTGDMHMHM
jgi:predicted metal-binding membrane protein